MNHSKEMVEALNRLSEIATEGETVDDIPSHFISKIEDLSQKKESVLTSTYIRNENFAKDKSFKIENKKRLKFLEELSELREKPAINHSLLSKNDVPLYLRAEQIMRSRNHSISSRRLENSRKLLLESSQSFNKHRLKSKGTEDFLRSIRIWQLNKERHIKEQKELKEEKDSKELKFSPVLNENSRNIIKKLKVLQGPSTPTPSRPEFFNKNKLNSPQPKFKPSISENTKKLTLNRTTSVFERLYTFKLAKSEEKKIKSKSSKPAPKLSETSSIVRAYSINSNKGLLFEKNIVENKKMDLALRAILRGFH